MSETFDGIYDAPLVRDLRTEIERLKAEVAAAKREIAAQNTAGMLSLKALEDAEAELAKLRAQISKCRICSETMKLDAVERQDFVEAAFWREAAAARGEGK